MQQYFIDKDTLVAGSILPIGYPVEDMKIGLFDEKGEAVSSNTVGKLMVKSKYLAVGYWNRPELSETRFKLAPENDGHRMYNTDDLGRIDTGGYLLHLGRKDFQVKIRGNSVELAEIEMALRQIEEVTDSVVIDTPATSGEQRQFYRPALGECGFLQRISWSC